MNKTPDYKVGDWLSSQVKIKFDLMIMNLKNAWSVSGTPSISKAYQESDTCEACDGDGRHHVTKTLRTVSGKSVLQYSSCEVCPICIGTGVDRRAYKAAMDRQHQASIELLSCKVSA